MNADHLFADGDPDRISVSTGAEILEEVAGWFRRFVFTVADADHDLLALWTAHSHVAEECYTTPRLQLDSPMPGSGKTTVLEHLARLCQSPVSMAALSSPALLTRMLDKSLRTVLIDEADRSLNLDKEGVADLFAVLNSGYKRGATRPVLVPVKGGGWDIAEMPTFSPVALAGNNPNLPEDTRSRIIRVLLLPDLDGQVEESDWELIEADAVDLAERLAAWCDAIRDDIRTCRPELPQGITGRFREKWGPLARVAELAGGRWPAAVAAMATQDKEQYEMDKEDGLVLERPAIVLLRHLHEVWPDDEPFASSEGLVASLVAKYPDAWGLRSPFGKDLTAKRMARMLATAYRVNSTRLSNRGARGYTRASLQTAWSRMKVGTPSLNPVHVAHPAHPAPVEPLEPLEPDAPDRNGPPTVCQVCGAEIEHGTACDGCSLILPAPGRLRTVPDATPAKTGSCQRHPKAKHAPNGRCLDCISGRTAS